ncbi:TIGR03862 family flavoprotein [Breoghania sp. JC706]|uniref:TIGR03862 family flavoprotein n=1 Tax=Breoghania sp. JC706 TaxID=3117732 RepID=UPI003009D9AB
MIDTPASSPAAIAIVGAGPAGLIAAETLAKAGHRVTVYDRLASPARRLLMAGRGGLNLTHDEDLDIFLARYGAARTRLEPIIRAFPPEALRAWADGLGAETFVGSSHHVFPKAMKASPLLRAWLSRLGDLGVTIRPRHRWTGWTANGALSFETPDGPLSVSADATLLALGGLSWPKLGADPAWPDFLRASGAEVRPLKPANCGFAVSWSPVFADRFAGAPLKTVELSFAGTVARGDMVVTASGIEGGPVYALSAPLRDAIEAEGTATLVIDLRPDIAQEALAARLARPRSKQSVSNFLRKAAGLQPVAIGLLREAGPLPDVPEALAKRIKACPLELSATAGIERAISSAGGVAFDGLDDGLMLDARPGTFVAGEMLDWEAPTGGYLLQASFSTGVAAARGMIAWLS